jgi:hypothetical protein
MASNRNHLGTPEKSMKTNSVTRFSPSHLLAAALAALALSLSAAQATTLAYDPFATSENYSVTAGGDSYGRILNQSGLSTANGFAPAWTDSPPWNGDTAVNYLYRPTGSLNYSGLATSGDGGIEYTPSSDMPRDARRALQSPVLLVSSTSFYMSYLLRTPATFDADAAATVYFRNTADALTTIGFGAGIANGNLVMQYRASDGFLYYQSLGTAWAPDTTYLFVAKVFENSPGWGNQDSLQVWVNPTDLATEAGLSSSALASALKGDTWSIAGGARNLGQVSVMAENLNGAGTVYFDEFRLGTTLADVLPVTPVPEPSTMALLGLGVGALVLIRRRK